MNASVVIRTHNEASRLRLTLASLECQQGLDEVVVVDDGSCDATREVLAEARQRLPLHCLHNTSREGRSAASNRGAQAARSPLLIFMDGDTLAGPGLVGRHVEAHAGGSGIVGRGETWHLRCTRFLGDPESGTFWSHQQVREVRLPEAERKAMRVTAHQIRHAFSAIDVRAAPGIYPGVQPRLLYEAEMDALRNQGGSDRLWAAASGSNLSLSRDLFLSAGGFNAAIDMNEHRELVYRLYQTGARLVPVEGARSYHLTHREGWRDPLKDDRWESAFLAEHPHAPIGELKSFWSGTAGTGSPSGFFRP